MGDDTNPNRNILKAKNLAILIVFATIGVLIAWIVLPSLSNEPSPLTDSELIAKTTEFREVQIFLEKYPNATSAIKYRSASEIAVRHEISNFELQGKSRNYSDPQFASLWMDIYMNEGDLRLEQVSLICRHGSFYTSKPFSFQIINSETTKDPNILEYLDKGREERCFDPFVEVEIDIEADNEPFDPHVKELIPVAIFTTNNFDASTIDVSSIKFSATGTAADKSSLQDVEGDGDLDMVLYFDTAFACSQTSAGLIGQTLNGTDIEGSDSINTVPCSVLTEQTKKE